MPCSAVGITADRLLHLPVSKNYCVPGLGEDWNAMQLWLSRPRGGEVTAAVRVNHGTSSDTIIGSDASDVRMSYLIGG